MTHPDSPHGGNRLGDYLKNRRSRLDPLTLGFAAGRRRTLGLRREEVAQRANISVAWYTLLEQGRGGKPSAGVLDRVATALALSPVEREHVFMLGLGRPPALAGYRGGDPITSRLQRLLDALPCSPAVVRTATWDVVAWNRAAALVFTDYGAVPAENRNVLRMIFCDPLARALLHDWDAMARDVVALFRLDAIRAGALADVMPLVEELCHASPEFAVMWAAQDVQTQSDGIKRLRHPELGEIPLEYSAFAVEGRPDLQMVVYHPIRASDREQIAARLNGPR
ncbi:helix-turn-helix transcriptional regulator [Robbsia sp. KACC 23696]|uniref:helix-turn-helix transcriptional regulator n=1 Tax=Robbsia sp. KACC 23696 TaxID=3149231 RepID=UPI00325BB225